MLGEVVWLLLAFAFKLSASYVLVTCIFQIGLILVTQSSSSFIHKLFVPSEFKSNDSFDGPSSVTCFYAPIAWMNPVSCYWQSHCTMCTAPKIFNDWSSFHMPVSDLGSLFLYFVVALARIIGIYSVAGTMNALYCLQNALIWSRGNDMTH